MFKEEDLIQLLKISPVMASIHVTKELKDHRGPVRYLHIPHIFLTLIS